MCSKYITLTLWACRTDFKKKSYEMNEKYRAAKPS